MSAGPSPGTRESRGGPQHIPRPVDSRPGAPAPWADLRSRERQPSLDAINAVFADTTPATSRVDLPSSSAVLAPLYEHGGETWVILTRRSWNLRSHTGEVSFPGGRREGDEDLWTTAIREAQEEIALAPELVVPVGELDHLATMLSNSAIVPYVGVLPGGRPELVPSEDEVDAILHVPLAELLDPAIYHQELWSVGGVERPLHFFELVGDTVWGATGSMLVDLLARITGTRDRAGRIR